MIKTKLRKAEIREGKIWLDSRIVSDPEYLKLGFVEYSEPWQNKSSPPRLEEAIEKDAPETADVYVLNERRAIERFYVREWNMIVPIVYLNRHLNQENRK